MQSAGSYTSNTTKPKCPSKTNGTFARSLLYMAMAMSVVLTACSDDDDEDQSDASAIDTSVPMGNFAVAMNDGQSRGSVTTFSPDLASMERVFTTDANQGLTVTPDGTLYQNGDIESESGIRAINRFTDRVDMDSFGASDRRIGAAAGKGLFALDDVHLLASCDVTDEGADLKMFSSTAGEQAQPVNSFDLPASCWDGFYAQADDRMYLALTNGDLAIIDDVSQLGLGISTGDTPFGPDVVDRLISIVGTDGVKQSVNLHGVAAENGMVLLSDVGLASSPTDGALYVFNDDGSVDGNVVMTAIAGPETMLGNPVDVLLVDGDAIVAEKSNDAILVFNGVAALGGDVAPQVQYAFSKPESLVSLPVSEPIKDATDIVSGDSVSRLLVSQNPAPVQDAGDGADNSGVARIAVINDPSVAGVVDTGLDVSVASVSGDPGQQSFLTLENIQLDAQGNGYAVYDVTDGSAITDRGILVISRLADRDDLDADTVRFDRMVSGVSSGLTSPKGIEIVGDQGALIVSDLGNDGTPASLVVISTNAGSDAMPLFTVTNTGSAAIWDADYDTANDRLYAAGTAGDVLVYDDFFAMGASAIPSRSFRVAALDETSNLHGIAYDAASDRILVTDVGSAASPTDGSFYIIENASTASGIVVPTTDFSGPATRLGNPVDLAFDGTSAYIAEKSNDSVLIYRDVMNLQGVADRVADESIAIIKPESVTLELQ